MNSSQRLTILAVMLCFVVSIPVFGQDGFNQPGTGNGGALYETPGAILRLTVLGENNKRLDRQSVVKVMNLSDHTIYYSTTTDRSETEVVGVTIGKYDVEVNAFGYLTAHKGVTVATAVSNYALEIVLKPDPSAVNLNAALSAQMPSKVRKQTQRGVTSLKAGDLKQAQKHLESAEKMEPSSSEISFLLGYLYMQRKENENAQKYFEKASTIDPHNVQALTQLGKLRFVEKNYAGARKVLEQAVLVDNEFWNAYYLLSDSCLRLKDYEHAREYAQLAVDKGKGAGDDAYLVLGQAQAHLGHDQEAIQALKSYLQHNPNSAAVTQVRNYIVQIERHAADSVKAGRIVPTTTYSVDTIEVANDTDEIRLAAKTWEPAGIDDAKPQVAADVTCPYDRVMDQAGNRVKELVDNVGKFAAMEKVVHENVDELGHPLTHETRQFDYSVEISESKGYLGVDEFRAAHGGLADFPEQIATRGFPALALVFHPVMRDNFQMTCEGLGQWKNQATWLVYFRQRDDRTNRIHNYRVGNDTYAADLKGRAWIAAENFQIVHMESELVSPIRKIQLLTEHQSVDYGPVLFAAKNEELWLPKNADLYIDFRRRRFHRRHSFDRFLLFSVDSTDKQKMPVAADKPDASVDQGPKQ